MSGLLALGPWALALTGALVAANERRARQRRAELVARACHELRGPLTAARLALELAARGAGATGPLAAAQGALGRAGLALADLDAAPRASRASDRSEPVAVAELLRDAAATMAPVARAHGVELRLGELGGLAHATVRGDPRRLAQACANLVANAIEHGATPVELSARARSGAVRIEVRDGGGGLPAPVGELIRRHRTGRGQRGRGLAIVADIAARHGGRLAAAPAARGARVALELPAWDGM